MRDRKLKIVNLTNYLIELQPWPKSLAFTALVSLIAGGIAAFIQGAIPALFDYLLLGLLLLAVPAGLAAFATTATTALAGKRLILRRSSYLTFFCTIILSVLLIIGSLIPKPFPYGILDLLVFGYVLVLGIRFFVLTVTYPYGSCKAFAFASIQSLFGLVAILALSAIILPGHVAGAFMNALALKAASAFIILFTGIGAFIYLINAPMQRNFGIKTFTLASLFLAHWFDQSVEIENILKKISDRANTIIGVIAFKTARAKGRVKSVIIVPYLHPGPFGFVGGGKLTRIFTKAVEKATGGTVLIPHGTATHDLNPLDSKQIDKMADLVSASVKSLRYEPTASAPVRVSQGKAKVLGQAFGNNALFVRTFWPEATEDIDFAIGLAAMKSAERGFERVLLSDAHNCYRPGDHALFSGDPAVSDLLEAVKRAAEKLGKEKRTKIKVGVGIEPLSEFMLEQGIGPTGLRAVVVEAGGKRTAYVVFDANNADPGMRPRIIAACRPLGIDEVELMTTDSHCVNSVRGVENPLGENVDQALLAKRAAKAVKTALSCLEPVSVGFGVIEVEGIDVLGPQKSAELAATINSTIAIMKVIAPAIFALAVAASLLSVLLLSW